MVTEYMTTVERHGLYLLSIEDYYTAELITPCFQLYTQSTDMRVTPISSFNPWLLWDKIMLEAK